MSLLDNDLAPDTVEAVRGGSGFYRPKRYGVLGMGPVGTAILAVAVLLAIVSMFLPWSFGWALLIAVGTGGFLLFAGIPDKHGKTGLQKLGVRRGFRRARSAGATVYTPGGLTHMGSHRLPGALAPSSLDEWETTDGEQFAVLTHPRTHLYSVTAVCAPDGASLLDQRDLDGQVQQYGHWLSRLAHEPDFVQGIVTIETAPTTGPQMRNTVERGQSPRAHALAKRVMDAILDQYPQGAQGVEVTATATFKAPPVEIGMDGKKIPRSERVSEAQQVGRLLTIRAPHLFADLPDCGGGEVRLMGTGELIQRVRVAYNPSARAAYDDARARGEEPPVTLWSSAGPTAAEEHWNWYQLGDAAAITWEFTGFTTSVIQVDSLLPLLETGADSSTRISIIYCPVDPAVSSRVVQRNYNAAEGRLRDAKKPTAKQVRAVRDAGKAARAEANGHALVDFTVLVTKTVDDVSRLPAVRAAVSRLAPNARLHLRSCDGQQAVAFAAGLGPLGLVVDRHLRTPAGLMNGI